MATIVTDNGGPVRSFRIEDLITAHPELQHVRTRVKTPGQNGSRERGFGTLKYERLGTGHAEAGHGPWCGAGAQEQLEQARRMLDPSPRRRVEVAAPLTERELVVLSCRQLGSACQTGLLPGSTHHGP